MVNIEWFKSNMLHILNGYELQFKFFEQGDFGSLNQIEFNSDRLGGNIDFWGNGWLGILVWDYQTDTAIYNILLTDEEEQEKLDSLHKLKDLLVNNR